MHRAYTWAELTHLSDNELISQHDQRSPNTVTGINYYLEELRHRRMKRLVKEQSDIAAKVECLTKWIFVLTGVVTVATIFNAVGIFLR